MGILPFDFKRIRISFQVMETTPSNSQYGIRTLNNNGIYTHQSVKMGIFIVDFLLVQKSERNPIHKKLSHLL